MLQEQVFLSDISYVDFKCGKASHLSNTISRYHMDTVSDSDADLYAVNFVAELLS